MIAARASRLAIVTGLYCIIAGVITLAGWTFNIPRMTDWDGRGISMFVNTAICGVLSGIALLVSMRLNWAARFIVRILGTIVGLIGGLTIYEHISNHDLGIDTFLIQSTWGQLAAASPMRMGPPASVSFAAIGTAFLMMSARRRWMRGVASGLCILVAAISMLSVIGYLYGAQPLFALPHLTGIAFQTATVILSISIGVIAAIPECGVGAMVRRDDPGGALLRRLLLPVILLSLILGWLRIAGQEVGLYDVAFGTAARTLIEIAMLTALLLWAANGLRTEFAARVRIDKALGAARSELLEAQRIAHIGSWQWDATTDVTAGSDELLRIYGFDPATEDMPDFRAQRGRCYPDADWERINSSIQHAMRTGEAYELDVRAIRCDGTPIWITTRGEVVRDTAGRSIGLRGTGQDITQRKLLEIERERLLDVERIARSEVERMARAKDEFLATVSHELRSPLNSISLWVQMLRNGQHDAATLAEGCATVESAIRGQARIIDDLVDLNRIAAGKLHLEVTAVNLAEVIEAAAESVRGDADRKSIRLVTSINPAVGPVMGDAVRLQQLISNLLSNAVKFTPRSGRVEVALDCADQEVRVCVRDTGQGIKPEFLPRVFDRFAQADGSISRRHGGLGLGLAIVKSIADLHQATVSVESEGEGRGATFEVRLAAADIQRGSTHAAARQPVEQAELGGVRILVADDDVVAAEFLSRLLEDRGAKVCLAGSGAAVWPAVEQFAPDILLCDISMPDVDGYEVIRGLRGRKWNMPAVAVTAFSRPEDKSRALEAGFDFHLAKPIDFGELVAVVDSALKRARRIKESELKNLSDAGLKPPITRPARS